MLSLISHVAAPPIPPFSCRPLTHTFVCFPTCLHFQFLSTLWRDFFLLSSLWEGCNAYFAIDMSLVVPLHFMNEILYRVCYYVLYVHECAVFNWPGASELSFSAVWLQCVDRDLRARAGNAVASLHRKCNYTAVMCFLINYVGLWKQTIGPKGNYQYTNMLKHLQVREAKAQNDSQCIPSVLVKGERVPVTQWVLVHIKNNLLHQFHKALPTLEGDFCFCSPTANKLTLNRKKEKEKKKKLVEFLISGPK